MSRPLRKCNLLSGVLALNSGDKSKMYFSRSKFLMLEWRGSNWSPATPVVPGWHIFCVYYSPGSAAEIAFGKHICWTLQWTIPYRSPSSLSSESNLYTSRQLKVAAFTRKRNRITTGPVLAAASQVHPWAALHRWPMTQGSPQWRVSELTPPSCKKIEGFHEKYFILTSNGIKLFLHGSMHKHSMNVSILTFDTANIDKHKISKQRFFWGRGGFLHNF